MTAPLLGAVFTLVFCLVPASAGAHLGSTKYLSVQRTSDGATVTVAVDAIDVSMELGQGEEPDLAALLDARSQIVQWLEEGISVLGDGQPCEVESGPLVESVRDGRPFIEVDLTFGCDEGTSLVLRDGTVFEDDRQHEAFVSLVGSDDAATILRVGRQEMELDAERSSLDLFVEYAVEGAIHLITGYDHVLFLLALLLAAGLVAKEDGVRAAIKDVALLVTAFTVGHSVTLAIAALEVWVLPSRPVEVAIAASIVVVAAYNAISPKARKAVPWVALGFGLIHGFGFSSVLKEQGLGTGSQVLALLAFNLGIEVAQLAVVLIVVPLLARLAESDRYENYVVRGGSAVIGLVAVYWVIERVI